MISKAKTGLAILGAASAISFTGPAFAQMPEGSFYVGGSFGQAKVNDFCDAMGGVAARFGASLSSCDEKDSAWKLFGGYQFNHNFALEASYFDYGEASASFTAAAIPFRVNGDGSAFGIAAVGILPLANQFSLFGKVGLLRTEFDFTVSGGGQAESDSISETGLHFGVGVMFNLGRFAIRAEWERNDELEGDMMSLGVQLRF